MRLADQIHVQPAVETFVLESANEALTPPAGWGTPERGGTHARTTGRFKGAALTRV